MKSSTKAFLVGGAVGAGAVLVYALTKKAAQGLVARFDAFELNVVDSTGTTTRQSTGETATDFQFYPIIHVVPDVNGTIEIDWDWINTIDGLNAGSSAHTSGGTPAIGDIVNTFTGLVAGQPYDLKLVDNRDPASTGRDPSRNGSIAIGDPSFVGWGLQDGLWHSFKSVVGVRVKSPSGASVNVSGQLGPENFKSVGALSASFGGFALTKV